MSAHGKQAGFYPPGSALEGLLDREAIRLWPEEAVCDLLGLVERLSVYLRVGNVEETDGEAAAWEAAQEALRRYKPVLAQTSTHA